MRNKELEVNTRLKIRLLKANVSRLLSLDFSLNNLPALSQRNIRIFHFVFHMCKDQIVRICQD